MNALDAELLGLLADPLDHEPLALSPDASRLDNAAGRRSYRILDGIPLLLPPRKRDGSPEREAPAAEAAAEATRHDDPAAWRDDTADDAGDGRGGELLQRLLGTGRGLVLDVGCGAGRIAALARGLGYTPLGVDLPLDPLRLAVRRLPVVQGSANALPFRDACVPLACTLFTVGSLENFEASVREIHRILEPGGRLVSLCAHPCFNGAYAQAEADGGVRVKPGYLREGWLAFPHAGPGPARGRAGIWHRPLSVLVNAYVRAGFTLLGVDEAGPDDDPLSLPDTLALSVRKR